MTDYVLSIAEYGVQTVVMNTYAADLKKRREAANLTVRELATAIDRSTTFITDFELRKKSNPPEPAMMERLAEALNWPVSDQLQSWGYSLGAAENRANPFDRDDPRYEFVESLKQLNLNDDYDAYVAVSSAQILRTMIAERETFRQDAITAMRALRASPKGTVAQE